MVLDRSTVGSLFTFVMVFIGLRVMLVTNVKIPTLIEPKDFLSNYHFEIRLGEDVGATNVAPGARGDDALHAASESGTPPSIANATVVVEPAAEADAAPDAGSSGSSGDDDDDKHLPSDWTKYLRPDIDIILSMENLAHRGRNGAEGLRQVNKYGHVIVKLKVRNHHGFRDVELEKPFIPFLPEFDWGGDSRDDARHASCAIVGNGGTMKGSGFGSEIDQHDAVFRINYAPARGFGRDVGSVTTYDFVNKENCMKLARGEHRWRHPKSTLVMWEAHSRSIRNQVYLKILKNREVEGRTLWLLSPAVVSTSRMIWLKVKGEIENEIHDVRRYMAAGMHFNHTRYSTFVMKKAKKLGAWGPGQEKFTFHNKPMTGMVTLFFGIQLCNSIDLYGFEPFTGESRFPYHYFDSRAGMVNVHSFDMALEIFRRVSTAFPLNIRKRRN